MANNSTPFVISDKDRARFWSKVDKRGVDECWEWQGSIGPDGYGRFCIKYKTVYPHRIAWIVTHGPIVKPLQACHKCDNRACCNPAHLFMGTQQDNVRDMFNKGRGYERRGANNPRAKLSVIDVCLIKALYNSGYYTQAQLASMFNVSIYPVASIINGKSWKTLDLDDI